MHLLQPVQRLSSTRQLADRDDGRGRADAVAGHAADALCLADFDDMVHDEHDYPSD